MPNFTVVERTPENNLVLVNLDYAKKIVIKNDHLELKIIIYITDDQLKLEALFLLKF